ncbi:tRNA uridine-5-carboxymethylaminomethyl(34) synthesis GTPase MnmE [Microvirga sp. SRT01]|uniref:tRNA modification GTPase MnmE n=1 Tax=Sphingomonas longa TaxID=2778730 RepID=A0ABS2D7N0_9SPHN|nr:MULTISPECIES: tRNA uridine-5-carboxymethylaminomethyl(34) synthesis GTPase MnmE [Alphaproteobacteria]MBM6576942.1 tRNA uridine-5-carboxymethylaminomethyl(34) synthesis GTPase MnmE [Sphingomonas sp. BT552]MBR7709986.1 tRNA uridine-5-carboxymethylaminomethyl(34) synthesis GTPase MnmE [Microvirga sp. SRT01]
MIDTIAAVSSGQPPAAIAVIRVSGPAAFAAGEALAGSLPSPRTAKLRTLRDPAGSVLDRVLMLAFPGPATATGEDLVEIHCHGGRAVVASILTTLVDSATVRLAEPGEFTRRALTNGRIDLTEAEGLADLLAAETEGQRRVAIAAAEGNVSRSIEGWITELAILSARIEAVLDYGEDDAVDEDIDAIALDARTLGTSIHDVASAPPVDALHRGIVVVLAGPPNAGKSTLLNLLAEQDAAIVSPIAGTTRDRIEVQVARGGLAYRLTDTAGLTRTDDIVEAIGVGRAEQAIDAGDIVLWLGDGAPPRQDAIRVHAKSDLPDRRVVPTNADVVISQSDPQSIEAVWNAISARAVTLIPSIDLVPLRAHQAELCRTAAHALLDATRDPLLLGENLRIALKALAAVTGADATEAMLDALFSRFCLGK